MSKSCDLVTEIMRDICERKLFGLPNPNPNWIDQAAEQVRACYDAIPSFKVTSCEVKDGVVVINGLYTPPPTVTYTLIVSPSACIESQVGQEDPYPEMEQHQDPMFEEFGNLPPLDPNDPYYAQPAADDDDADPALPFVPYSSQQPAPKPASSAGSLNPTIPAKPQPSAATNYGWGASITNGSTQTISGLPAANQKALASFGKNLGAYNSLKHGYGVGDVVTSYIKPKAAKYRVLSMRACSDPDSGMYEVRLGLVEGDTSDMDLSYWYPASCFWPDYGYVAAPKAKKVEDRYPHKCPRCGSKAYVGLSQVDCASKCH